MGEFSENIVEIYAESKHPAKWAAMQIVKAGRPTMTCGEAMDMIERVVNEAIQSAMRNTLPCGHPGACNRGGKCGWCKEKEAAYEQGCAAGMRYAEEQAGRGSEVW